jgi:predicted ATPase/class 3 adenylate cyclase
MMGTLPSGTVTFLFTDIEGSTRRWESQPEAMKDALARHDAILRACIERHGGAVFKTVGDAFHAAFATASDALGAALDGQRTLAAAGWAEAVRMALHTGAADERDGDYFGPPLNRVARLRDAGHGGQTLLSSVTGALVQGQVPDGVALRDLGRHRLRDLAERDQVYEAAIWGLRADFPPLRLTDLHPTNLPRRRERLIGRDRATAAISALLGAEETGLVTLTGTGGTGKTRLALAVGAALLDRFPDGVFVVDLAPLADPALVPTAIGQVLGVSESGGTPLLTQLTAYLRARALLLILDNFEHLLPAAPVVADLLAAAPALKVLVTSRTPLHLRGEKEYAVPPLALPDAAASSPGDIAGAAAAALFVERARELKPDFAVTDDNAPAVAEICRRLDGLPLAIELAAARTRVLTPQAMLARLVGAHGRAPLLTGGGPDRPARQQTLRATIEWSFELLGEAERRLFRRLAVFVGGFSVDAAEAVCADLSPTPRRFRSEPRRGGEPNSTAVTESPPSLRGKGVGGLGVLDALTSLVEQNLLTRMDGPEGEPRFGMLETIREFALEHLASSGEAADLQGRHAAYYHAYARQGESGMFGPERERRLSLLTAEQGNLRAVLQWGLAGGDVQVALDTAAALQFWFITVSLGEGRSWLEGLLTVPAAAARTPARARALRVLAWLCVVQSDFRTARVSVDESVTLWRTLREPEELALALLQLATCSTDGAGPTAIAAADEAVVLAREAGSACAAAFGRNARGLLAMRRGDLPVADAAFSEAAAIAREAGARAPHASFIMNGALVDSRSGDADAAIAKYTEALALFRGLGDHAPKWLIARTLVLRGDIAYRQRRLEEAEADYREALPLSNQVGALGEVARCLSGLGRVALRRGAFRRAARLFSAQSNLETTYRLDSAWGLTRSPQERQAADALVAETRTALGEEAFAAAWAEGSALSLDAAVALALEQVEQPTATP